MNFIQLFDISVHNLNYPRTFLKIIKYNSSSQCEFVLYKNNNSQAIDLTIENFLFLLQQYDPIVGMDFGPLNFRIHTINDKHTLTKIHFNNNIENNIHGNIVTEFVMKDIEYVVLKMNENIILNVIRQLQGDINVDGRNSYGMLLNLQNDLIMPVYNDDDNNSESSSMSIDSGSSDEGIVL